MKTHQNQTIHVGKCTNDIIDTIECFGNDTQVVFFFSWGNFSRIQKTPDPQNWGRITCVMSWVGRVPPGDGTDHQPIQGDTVLPIGVGCHGQNIPFPIRGVPTGLLGHTPWKFNIHSSPLKILYHPTPKEAGSSSFPIIFQGLCLLNFGGCIWILMR